MSRRVRYLKGQALTVAEPSREDMAPEDGTATLAEVLQASMAARARQRRDEMRYSFIVLGISVAGMAMLALLARCCGGGQ